MCRVACREEKGRELTKRYYAWSPLLVKVLEEDNVLRNLVTGILAGMLPLINRKQRRYDDITRKIK